MAVSKRLRYEILRRDNHTCRYCGAAAPDVPLRVDHVTPVALGGSDKPENLATSCEPCNSGKSSATVDATTVAAVSDDALRWATAMQQAADNLREQETPKTEYRDAFLAEWNRWHVDKDETKKVPLDDDWKQSIERFRVAGIPTWMWADIVDIGMANKKVAPKNTFRYCCGIAWNKVTELQAEARKIVEPSAPVQTNADAVAQAAVDVWTSEQCGGIDSEALAAFRSSVEQLRKREDPYRILYAARHAAWFGMSDAADALRTADEDDALQQWTFAWLTATGDYPDEARTKSVQAQIDTLLDADVYIGRVTRAASYAGARRTTYLHFGLGEDEQQLLGTDSYFIQILEIWAEAFQSAAGRWPEREDRKGLLDSLERIGRDSDVMIVDVCAAAAAAGAYQDPDITTCLTRRLSAIEIAARPLGGDH